MNQENSDGSSRDDDMDGSMLAAVCFSVFVVAVCAAVGFLLAVLP